MRTPTCTKKTSSRVEIQKNKKRETIPERQAPGSKQLTREGQQTQVDQLLASPLSLGQHRLPGYTADTKARA